MKNLIELTAILTRKKVRKIEVLDESVLDNPQNKFDLFYKYLIEGKIKTDRDAAQLLYQSTPADAKYRKLKSRFRKRLLNTVFFLERNLPNQSSREIAFFNCQKTLALIHTLHFLKGMINTFQLAKKYLQIAIKYHFPFLVIQYAKFLTHRAKMEKDHDAYKQYTTLIEEYFPIWLEDQRTASMVDEIELLFFSPATSLDVINQKLNEYLPQLSHEQTINQPGLEVRRHYLKIYQLHLTRSFQQITLLFEHIEQTIKTNHHLFFQNDFIDFQFLKLNICLHLRNYNEASTIFYEIENQNHLSQTEKLRLLQYYLIILLHCEELEEAIQFPFKENTDQLLKGKSLSQKALWNLFYGYLFFVENFLKAQKSSPKPDLEKSSAPIQLNQSIQLEKGFQSLPLHQQILRIILHLQSGNLKKAAANIGELRNSTRRLKEKPQFHRHLRFIHYLHQLKKNKFIPEKLSGDLNFENPFYYRGLLDEMEVIPYEILWKMIVFQLSIKSPS